MIKSGFRTMALVLASVGISASVRAAEPPPAPPAAAPAPVGPVAPPPAMGPGPTAPVGVPMPMDAAASLERVRAAYEYGDIDSVVEWSRPVAEGRIPATVLERGHALRYLGIGLYLTGRAPGAEAAFLELLRLRPDSTLDPRTTRPDVVTFFERIRSRHSLEIRASARENNHKTFLLNFLPPLGQLQNGNRGRALLFGGLELVSAATAATTYALLTKWEKPGHTFPGRENDATIVRTINWAALSILAATYVLGVIDGVSGYSSDLPDEAPAPARAATGVALSLSPTGLAVTF
ncbi:MAG TPA: hypothetical protein VIU64_21110 [Polyangia bacterium]